MLFEAVVQGEEAGKVFCVSYQSRPDCTKVNMTTLQTCRECIHPSVTLSPSGVEPYRPMYEDRGAGRLQYRQKKKFEGP